MIALFCVLIAMASIQSGSSIAKGLFPVAGVLGTVGLRLLFAAILLSLIWKPWRLRLTRDQYKSIALYGASLGLMNLLFYLSLSRIPLGIAVSLEFIGPLSIALFTSRRAVDVLWALIAGLGIFLIFPLQDSVESLDMIGVFYALAAGIFWTSYIIFGQRVGTKLHGGVTVCLGMIVASLVVSPFALFVDGSKIFTNPNILPFALGVAVLSSAFPYSLEMVGLRAMPAKTFSILMSLEPALGALCGFVFLKESLSFQQWIAVVCVMLASAGSSLRN